MKIYPWKSAMEVTFLGKAFYLPSRTRFTRAGNLVELTMDYWNAHPERHKDILGHVSFENYEEYKAALAHFGRKRASSTILALILMSWKSALGPIRAARLY